MVIAQNSGLDPFTGAMPLRWEVLGPAGALTSVTSSRGAMVKATLPPVMETAPWLATRTVELERYKVKLTVPAFSNSAT